MSETPAEREERRRRGAEIAELKLDGFDDVRAAIRRRQGPSGHRSLPLTGGKRSANRVLKFG